MIYIAEPLIYENNIIAAIRTSTFIGDVDKIIGKYVYNIVFFSLIAVLISIGAILFIYYTFKNTVSKFSFFSKSVAKGDFDIKLKLKENYENSELEKSFNNMTNKLKDLFQDLSNEKEELNSIISSVKEGIMVIDKDGIVVRVNESFKSICKDKNPISKYYWELLRIENIDKIINRVDSETKNYDTEVEINARDYLASINYIFLKREIVIIFHDITEIKEFEKSKKDLASNVSHELNTPLAAIKGYVETLIDEETDSVKLQRLKVVENHTERLINIVKDLLLLSSVDEKKVDFDDNVDISTVVSNSIRIFDMKIKEKNLNLKFFPEPDIPQIKGDAFKIEQVIINLID
ncbi:MAG TPA: histidine kinase dimerization/phospho-acceptor domain-containing protein, partial [Spirochaetota bacterium]|nr:histidine kinase dimerization/phospho-acceptor domain-containing protein [Spirochaetota bacterium]